MTGRERGKRWRRAAWIAVGFFLFAVLLLGALPLLLRGRLDPYLDSDSFRAKIAEETSRGLKVKGVYTPITHLGWDAFTDGWLSTGRPGEAIVRLDAQGVSARFNPWGVFRRVWQLDWVDIDSAVIELRKADPAQKVPLEQKPKPWYAFLLPQRMDLKVVNADRADILWKLNGETVGIHHATLRITPYGKKDWRFTSVGEGARLILPPAPPLRAYDLSIIVTKPYFYVERASFASEEDNSGWVALSGRAGVQPEDPSMECDAKFIRLPLTPWMPEEWREKVGGWLVGALSIYAAGTSLEGSAGQGEFVLHEAFLRHLMVLDQFALFSGNAAFRDLHFEKVEVTWHWRAPRLDVTRLEIEAPGRIRLEGAVRIDGDKLSGTLRLGLRAQDLRWLPQGGKSIFAEEAEGMRWTPVVLSGTPEHPQNDLAPRIRHAIVSSPGTMLKLGWKEFFHPVPKEKKKD